MLGKYSYTADSLKKVIKLAVINSISHKDLVDWCEGFLQENSKDTSISINRSKNKKAIMVALDIENQWELYLSNTYTFEELQILEQKEVKMPKQWLEEWDNSIQ
ncbi:hypothetical protein O0Q50_21990 [Priestia aryabhattai]|uniref:Uncharacterized protein n=1 Tax=Priestia aryabhattai TaxID=412384 RepID=A0AAX6NEC8_PRIAR|nr:hypothetical protein [Priestia aryabhattai]MDU9693854.1 hypothetical protein [Priestia aryabhattai]